MQLDGVDYQILEVLQSEGRLTNKEVALRVGLSASACLKRIRRLEREGVITGYRAVVDHAAVGAPFEFWGEISLADHAPEIVARFSALLHRTPEIISAYKLAGRHDFLVHAIAPSMEKWEALMRSAGADGIAIATAKTSVVVGRVKSNAPIGFTVRPPRLVGSAA